MSESAIPQAYVDCAREIAAITKKYKLQKLNATFTAPYSEKYGPRWNDPIHLSWEQGRHGEDNNRVTLTSEVRTNVKVEIS